MNLMKVGEILQAQRVLNPHGCRSTVDARFACPRTLFLCTSIARSSMAMRLRFHVYMHVIFSMNVHDSQWAASLAVKCDLKLFLFG